MINYLLLPVMAILLVSGQTIWASAIKNDHVLSGNSLISIVANIATSWKMWAGAFVYITATFVYFYLLSKLKFFSVQIAMTALSIIASTLLSSLLFHEHASFTNLTGIAFVLTGVLLILYK